MERTGFTNIVIPHGGPLGCMPYSVKGFSEINEDMVQILLMQEDISHMILSLKTFSVVLLPAQKQASS